MLVFVVAGVAVAGLAYVLGIATEEAGASTGPTVSALLNATFGNAAEAIIVILAVREGLIEVAKASIVGSVLGNLLLILGASLLVSGIRHGRCTLRRGRGRRQRDDAGDDGGRARPADACSRWATSVTARRRARTWPTWSP